MFVSYFELPYSLYRFWIYIWLDFQISFAVCDPRCWFKYKKLEWHSVERMIPPRPVDVAKLLLLIKLNLLPPAIYSSIPPDTFPAAQSSIGIPATTLDWDSRSENCLRPASCLWPRTGNTVRVTRPVRCFWYGWSSYYAWPSIVIDWIQSFITNRSQTVSFAGDVSTESVVTCGVP